MAPTPAPIPTPSTLPASAASGVTNSSAMMVATFQAVRMVTSWFARGWSENARHLAMFHDHLLDALYQRAKKQDCVRVTTRQRTPATLCATCNSEPRPATETPCRRADLED